MRGLDPRIHADSQQTMSCRGRARLRRMDCRVEPGNDDWGKLHTAIAVAS
jgi:hypothetical protein